MDFRLILFLMGYTECYRIVCYYESWSQYPTNSKNVALWPEDIDPHMCTHINYAFAAVDNVTHRIRPIEWNDEELYGRLVGLKAANPDLKILLSIGGYKHGIEPFISMASTPITRQTFIKDSISYLRRYGFDGLDIDWESPGSGDNPVQEKSMFTKLVKELREAYDGESKSTQKERLLLSIAVSAHKASIYKGYQPWRLSKSIDYVNLMAYDYHTGHWANTLGHNAPLCKVGNSTENLMSALELWTNLTMPRNKIVIGIPAYGTAWVPAVKSNVRVGEAAQWSRSEHYYNICNPVKDLTEIIFDTQYCAYYKVLEDRWISYDPPESYLDKCAVVKTGGYGGALVWSLSMDDHHGHYCGMGRFPLHQTISKCLHKNKTRSASGESWRGRKLRSDQRILQTHRCQDTNSCEFNIMAFLLVFLSALLCSVLCKTRCCSGLNKLIRIKSRSR